MSMRISFELSDSDLSHFKSVMAKARNAAEETDQQKIVDAARSLLEEVKKANAPEFISSRLSRLEVMINMVQDEAWALPDTEKGRVVSALAYFSDPEDLIPDDIPGLGFLDDAIMVELVMRELKHEIEAYQDFCKFRASEVAHRQDDEDISRASWLVDRRKQLQSRMRRRRRSGRNTRSGGGRGPFSLF